MGMGLTCGEDRFVFEKRFSKKEVLFEDITEITIEDKIFRITTRSGKELQAKMGVFAFHVPDEVFDVIRKHNIAFRDMDCLSESTKIVSSEELEGYIEKAQDLAAPIATAVVSEKLGKEYSVEPLTLFDDQFISMYFSLKKNGEPVEDLPSSAVYNSSPLAPGSFDLMTVAVLCKWDAVKNSGRYDLMIEMTDESACEKYVREMTSEFCEKYLEVGL